MLRKLIFLPAVIMLLSSCKSDKFSADLIIQNAVIYTADSAFSIEAAMAIADGKILEVGDNEAINEKYQADSVIDADGKAIYPGFIDAHSHFYGYALLSRYADLSGASSFDMVLEILKQHQEKNQSNWVTGRGWDQNKWPGHRFPDNRKLNDMFPEIPVVIIRVDGHAVLANEAAIILSGITSDSITNKKEAILEDGNFTGIFLESMADRFRNLIPEPAGPELSDLVTVAAGACYGVGLTMVTDAGLDARIIDFYDSLQKEDKLEMAIYAMLNPNKENLDRFLKRELSENPG
ncbi:MAG: amidohydrolase family protein [Bacteroidota bacterium]